MLVFFVMSVQHISAEKEESFAFPSASKNGFNSLPFSQKKSKMT